MDPLSISTGIITLLQATTAIISICYNFRSALKSAPWSLTRIIEELKCLRNILESLDELSHGLEKSAGLGARPVFESLSDTENGPLVLCLRELSILDNKIKSSSYAGTTGLRRRAALQALGWQLKDRDAKEFLERIERCKSILSLALSADEATVLVNIQELTTSLQATSQSIDYKITIMSDDIHSKDLDQEHNAMMQWLSPIDPCENHEAALSAIQKGTATWTLESKEFIEWHQKKGSFLWLSGFPGSGKTILFSRIIAHLMQNLDDTRVVTGIAYFYCEFTRSDFQNPRDVVGSLVAQLCSQFECPEELKIAFRNSLAPGQRRRPDWKLLKQALVWFSKARKIFIFIDALDECEKREEILDLLSEIRDDKGDISVLVTSREEADIQDAFQSYTRLRLENCRLEVNRDIKSYINHRLEVDANLKGLSMAVKADIKLSLNEKSIGMFRWVRCQLDALSQLRTVRAIRANLNQLPKGLNETYANILKRTNREDIELLRRVLVWVAFAIHPMTIEELREAIATEPGTVRLEEIEESRLTNPKDIIRIGSSLLSVSETGHVRLAHLSVKEYLLSKDIKETPEVSRFSMNPEDANQELTITCLTYLSLDSLANGPSTTLDNWEDRLECHPLLKHAAKAWPYYLRRSRSAFKLIDIVSKFFGEDSHEIFMSWIQVLNSNWVFKWNEYPRHATRLYYAASFGLGEIVDDLIRTGVDLNVPGSRFGGTALHGATLREHIPIMNALLEAGASPSQADFNLITPLHTAARIGNAKVIKLLLDYGASKAAVDSLSETPYDWALQAKQVAAQRLLQGEACQFSAAPSKTMRDAVYQRPDAPFPALAVAQGLALPFSRAVERL